MPLSGRHWLLHHCFRCHTTSPTMESADWTSVLGKNADVPCVTLGPFPGALKSRVLGISARRSWAAHCISDSADRQTSTLAQVLNSRLVVLQSATGSLVEVRDAVSTRGLHDLRLDRKRKRKKNRKAISPRLWSQTTRRLY
jgi:hypothetical protein